LRQIVLKTLQKLIVDYRFLSLSRFVKARRHLLFEKVLKTVNYRERFVVICDSESRL